MTIMLAQAIRNAIEAERAAEQFYLDLAGVSADVGAQAFLRQVASEEREHAVGLELVGRQLVQGELPLRADMVVNTIESAPALAGARDLGYEQALSLALEAELGASLVYDALASSCGGEVGDFFLRVAQQEERHADRIRAALAAGPPPRYSVSTP